MSCYISEYSHYIIMNCLKYCKHFVVYEITDNINIQDYLLLASSHLLRANTVPLLTLDTGDYRPYV